MARRWRALDDEARELDRHIKAILDQIAAALLAVHGVGYETAGQLLVTAGDNPGRLGHEKSFAALCGSSPVQASSGRTNRHRLNRGGDRQANSALWTIVLTRMVSHAPTKAYVERRTTEGLSKTEIMRCLKRYVARELYPLVQAITITATPGQRHANPAQLPPLTSRGASVLARSSTARGYPDHREPDHGEPSPRQSDGRGWTSLLPAQRWSSPESARSTNSRVIPSGPSKNRSRRLM